LKILSLLDSAQNLLQNDHYISHQTLKALLHYPVKTVMFKLLASSGANIRAIFGLLLLRFQSVLPFFFSFFSSVSSLPFNEFFS